MNPSEIARIINEDIAALRNISWSVLQKYDVGSKQYELSYPVWAMTTLIIAHDPDTSISIKRLLQTN